MTDRHSITQHTYKNQEKTIMALNYSPIGWRATEGVLDYRELLSSFQDGLKEEIENSNRTPSRSIRIYNGIFIA